MMILSQYDMTGATPWERHFMAALCLIYAVVMLVGAIQLWRKR